MKIPSEKKHVQKLNVFAGLLAKHAYAAKKHDAYACARGGIVSTDERENDTETSPAAPDPTG